MFVYLKKFGVYHIWYKKKYKINNNNILFEFVVILYLINLISFIVDVNSWHIYIYVLFWYL